MLFDPNNYIYVFSKNCFSLLLSLILSLLNRYQNLKDAKIFHVIFMVLNNKLLSNYKDLKVYHRSSPLVLISQMLRQPSTDISFMIKVSKTSPILNCYHQNIAEDFFFA